MSTMDIRKSALGMLDSFIISSEREAVHPIRMRRLLFL
jgi:hypothetical protein